MRDWRTSGPNGGMPVSNCDPRSMEQQAREILDDIAREKCEERAMMRARERELAKMLKEMPRVVRDHARAKKMAQEEGTNLPQAAETPVSSEGHSSSGNTEVVNYQHAMVEAKKNRVRALKEGYSKGHTTGGSREGKGKMSLSRSFRRSSLPGILSKLWKSHDPEEAYASCDSCPESSAAMSSIPDHDTSIASIGALRKDRMIKSRKMSSRLKKGFQVIFGLDKPKPLVENLSIYLGENYKDKGTLRTSIDVSDSESEAPRDEEAGEANAEAGAHPAEANGEGVFDDGTFYWRPAPVSQPLKPV